MNERMDLAKIVRQAQQGHKESLELLGAQVRPRVMVYLYRMTQDYHLAQDLTQETMLTLIQSLQHLRTDSRSSLWGWIYRTALGKVQHYSYRQARHGRSSCMVVDHEALDRLAAHPTQDGLDHAQRKELIEAVGKSLEALKITYRHVLVLRCFEQLSFADIAAVVGGGSELRMRLLFLRAKRALGRQLHNRGFGRQYFLSGLTLFATITTLRTKSAVATPAVTAELAGAGAAATTIGALTAPWGIAAVATIASTLMVGAVFVRGPDAKIPTVRETVPWAFSSRIINAYDPDGDGWERLIPHDLLPNLRAPLDPNTIVSQSGDNFFLILPEGHWIEFGFPGHLVDGPGPDIEYYCLKDSLPTVFLTDGGTQAYELKDDTRELLQNWAYRVEFDLDGLQCPFAPTAIRIVGHGPPTGQGATILVNLKARAMPEDRSTAEDG